MISNNDMINYNNLSETYEKRYDYDKHPQISNAINNLIEKHQCKSILEVGAGTCYWLKSIFDKNTMRTGIDISLQMLLRSGKNLEENYLINGDSHFLPFKSNAFDFIFCVNALHHFRNKSKFFDEAISVLKKKGLIAIYTLDPRTKSDHWHIYDNFEGIYQQDLNRFLSTKQIVQLLSITGFKNINVKKVEFISDDKTPINVLNDPFLQKHGSSQMAMLSNKEYQRGINKIKEKIKTAKNKGKQLIFPVRLTMFEITGFKS